MKLEEIIKYLEMVRPAENYSHTFSVSVGKTRHFGPGSQLNKDVSKAIDLAIQALEKQIPKKPQLESYGYSGGELVYDEWFCPKCGEGYEIDSHDYNYCPECGQCIDRSEIDEA